MVLGDNGVTHKVEPDSRSGRVQVRRAAIGVAAPLILVLLRLVQGIAIGGEWSGSVLLAMEWGNQRKRGLLGSFAQIGVPVGLVLGTGGMTLLSATLSPDAFNSWGWRI